MADGSQYRGEHKMGVRHGFGVHLTNEPSKQYAWCGEWREGRLNYANSFFSRSKMDWCNAKY